MWYVYINVCMYVRTQDMHAYVHTFCMYICCVVVYMCVPHLLHSRGSSEEQVPLSVRDLPGLPQDVGTEHEGEDQFVLLKETPVDVGVCVGVFKYALSVRASLKPSRVV